MTLSKTEFGKDLVKVFESSLCCLSSLIIMAYVKRILEGRQYDPPSWNRDLPEAERNMVKIVGSN